MREGGQVQDKVPDRVAPSPFIVRRIASGHDSEGRRKNHRESVSWTDHRGESLARSEYSRYYPRDDTDTLPEGIKIQNAFKASFE
ncbi:hypothetical protein HZH68_012293 [Vespula germanica]|uniref:Uncharacterized protein n=1 Tax=Vespula germanica TaxID=30212 RepID=A0A834JN12_VESGE|nr:hypothetical protein HZH68_012293 [Vespula germanica]